VVAAVGRCLCELVYDRLRRGQVGVAHAEVDDVLAAPARLCLQVIDLAEDVGRQAIDAAQLHISSSYTLCRRMKLHIYSHRRSGRKCAPNRWCSLGQASAIRLTLHAQDDNGNVCCWASIPRSAKARGSPAPPIPGSRPGGRPARHSHEGGPPAGTPSYLQGWAPAIDFGDRAKVLEMGQRVSVPAGDCADVLATEEWDPTDPTGFQTKYYAAGVGNVRVGSPAATWRRRAWIWWRRCRSVRERSPRSTIIPGLGVARITP